MAHEETFAEARRERLKRLRLIAITDVPPDWPTREHLLARALAAGLPAVMLRAPDVDEVALRPAAQRLRELTAAAGALLIVNRRIELARHIDADGVHTGRSGSPPQDIRRVLGEGALIGYSAHAVDEARKALAAGADYVTLSPIFATPPKKGTAPALPLGLEPLHALCRHAPGPVLALGGVDPTTACQAAAAGAFGAAAIRAFWEAPDLEYTVRAMLAAFDPDEASTTDNATP